MRVVIVGGGIIGTMHALEAQRCGHEVVQLERDGSARSASVRNFGHLLVSGRAPGPELDVAVRARVRWEEIASQVPGVGFAPVGTLNVALAEDERRVHEEVAARDDAALRGFRVLTPGQVEELEPNVRGAVTSGLFSDRDARVEPGVAVGRIQRFLAEQPTYRLVTGRTIVEVDETAAIDHTGARHDADLVLLCTGADHDLLDADGALHRCQLQMFETAPLDHRLNVSVTDAGSLRYYPAFAGPATDALDPTSALEADWRIQLLAVQRNDGSLTVGDTHVYDEPFRFDYDTDPEDLLVRQAAKVFGRDLPAIRRRWLGVYSKCRDDTRIEYREAVADGVWAVTGLAGRGMTLSPAIAERTFEEYER